MISGSIGSRAVRIASLLAVSGVAALLCTASGQATEPSGSAAFRACYKSVRSCEKSRCGKLDGREQVSCMRQCNHEYESCVGAGQGGGMLSVPQKDVTPGTAGNERRRNMQRNKTPGVPN